MIRRKYVPLRIVQPGMMIDQAIIDRAGRVLIARRTRLEDFHIDALKKMGVTGIYTCEGTEDVKPADADKPQELPEPLQKKYEQVKVKDPAKVQISESVRSRVAQGVQYLYQDTQSPDFTNASRSITDDLLRAIEDNDAVAVDIGALKISDEYTFKHSVDVATMSMIVARKYGLDDKQVYEIGIAGLLHDIGKSKVPNEILNKAARLTDEEFAIMKQHSVYGYRILQSKEDLSMEIKLGVLQHHEKMNGKGYPMGITGDKIDLFAGKEAVFAQRGRGNDHVHDGRAGYYSYAVLPGERYSLSGRHRCGIEQRRDRPYCGERSQCGAAPQSSGSHHRQSVRPRQ